METWRLWFRNLTYFDILCQVASNIQSSVHKRLNLVQIFMFLNGPMTALLSQSVHWLSHVNITSRSEMTSNKVSFMSFPKCCVKCDDTLFLWHISELCNNATHRTSCLPCHSKMLLTAQISTKWQQKFFFLVINN